MTSRFAGMLAGVVLAVGLAAPAARAQARVEKIPLQHIDVRIVAALLGAPVLPNELELAQQRSLGGGVAPGYGYGGSPYGGGYGYGASPYGGAYASNRFVSPYPTSGFAPGYAPGYGQTANTRAPWFAQGNAPSDVPQPWVVADPNTNSVIRGR